MSAADRVSWNDGMVIASAFGERIRPVCARLCISGSLRRGKSTVGDVEMVARAAYDAAGRDVLAGLLDDLVGRRVIEKRHKSNGHLHAWGARYRALWFQGMAVDLFIVQPDRQWGVTYLLRTGPGDANQALVTSRQRGGLMPDGVRMQDGALWRGDVRLDTPEEWHVFHALGLPWVPPYLRDEATYQRAARRRREIGWEWPSWLGHEPTAGYVWWGGRPYEVPAIAHLAAPVDVTQLEQIEQIEMEL